MKCIGKVRPLLTALLLTGLFVLAAGVNAGLAEPPHLTNQDAASLAGVKAPFTFAVIGDNRGSGEEIYGRLMEEIAGGKPALVIHTGDTVKESDEDSEWREFVELSRPLKAPYFIVPGNHEMDEHGAGELFRERVRQPGNELYYSVTAGGALFIVLNSEEPGSESRITGAQYNWLEGVLKNSKERFRFAFMHRPMYPAKGVGRHYKDSMNKYPKDRDRLERLFEKYGVNAVFCGHEHLYMKRKVGNIYHVVTGGGGAPLYEKPENGGFHHYIKVKVNKGSAEVRVVGIDGGIRDSFTISKDAK